MATPQASSRLELLQARFQQKQLQEKEQKLLQLYDQQQQRAYQVVQRGSAGSNGSNHGSSINQHTVTKTTTTSHTTSTSQGGKVRQMFDERRQTTVKGIDRSYPLEPLENKPRKQTNGNVAQKNGNLTVNRQSVTVKRVARADVNSNLNGGKPIVSYHEEITRESYGPGGRQQSDDDEFGNENHINQYANGNQVHIEEVLNDDTIERNRMMAKLHLMEYDETLKHRVKNDLESEEFPEDFMVDVPDKLPKQSVSKKLSQAEARLERFKHANAKRSNSLTKNPSNVLKKRSDPILPVKSTSSEDEGRTRIRAGSSSRGSRNIGRSIKNASLGDTKETSLSFSWKNENPRFFYKHTETVTDSKGDDEGIGKTRRSASPKFFCKESNTSATTYAIDSKTREKLSPEFTNIKRRSDSPKLFDSKSTNQLSLKDRAKRSESPKFFCKESDKSATTYAIDSRTREKLSPEFTRNTRPSSPSSKTTTKAVDKIRRSESPKFFCKESERSATTYAIDSKTREKLSPEYSKGSKQRSESPISSGNLSPEFSRIITKRSDSPKFFCKESEKSATTYAIDSKTREKLSPEYSKGSKQRSESPISSGKLSPEFSRIITKRSDSPKFFCKESEKSATTYAIDSKTREKLSPEYSKGSKQRSESPISSGKLSPEFSRIITKRSDSPKFFCKESERSATTYVIDSKTREKLSPEFSRNVKKRSESPKFNRKGSEKSATAKDARRSESPKFFCRESEKSATTYAIDSRSRSTSPDFIKLRPTFEVNVPINPSISIGTVDRQINHKSKDMAQTFSPKAYQKQETELNSKSAQNRMPNVFERLTRRGSSPKCLQSNSQDTKFLKSADITRKVPRESADSKSVDLTRKLSGRSSTSPQFFTSDSERSATIMLVTPETIVKRKPEPLKVDKTKEASKTRDTFIVEPARRMSEEIIDESSKHNIRSSVSRFFSEQCAKASRNPEDGTIDKVQSVEGGWSRDSSPLSLRDTRTSPRSAEFSGTSADSIRDWSSKSKRNGGHLSREFLENKSNRDSIKNDSIKESTRISLRKSKSPDVDRRSTNVLRSTRLIRDAINRQDNTIEKDQGSRRSRRNEAGISIGADSRKKVETCGKVGRSRTTGEVRETGSSPKSFASAEVDAEIQETTMPDQYVERRPREVNAKSRDKTRRSSAEKLLTYSVRKPERKRGSLFESSVLELSKRDQEKTDRRETSGKERKYTVKTQNNPSPTNNFTFRCSRRRINEDSQSRGERADEDDGFKRSGGNWSSSPSPTSNFTSYTSKAETKGNKGVNRKIGADIFHSRERKVLDEYDKRSFSSSPPPINLATRKMNRRIEVERLRSKEGTVNSVRSNATRRLLDDYNKEKCDIKSSSPSPTIYITKTKNITKQDSRMKSLNSQGKKILNKSNDLVIPGSKRRIAETGVTLKILHRKTPSPVQSKQKKSSSKPSQILRSMELVRKVITGGRLPIDETKDSIENKETRINKSDSTGKSSSTIVYINGESSNYERTDSVESALKRFDSIGAESVQSEKKQTVEESKAISLKALDRIDANLSENLNRQPSLKRSPAVSVEMDRNQSNTKCGRKFARARDSIEITRIVTGSKSAACKRKLFQDDSGEETETSSLDSSGKYLRSDSRTKRMLVNNGETHEPSLSVKQLRSIEDIRKSIEPCFEARGSSTKSAIANDTLKLKRLPRRSENFGRMKDDLGDAERSAVKCAIRFSRVTKSPSPDSKTTENRARRNVLSSPSKSPDIVARRSSTEMKAQETRSTKRPTLMKGAEPIGNRKTTPTSTTTTSTRKSTDVVDGAILENGVHLRDQTAETKYDNDSAATKKSSAFVIDFDEQPPKENDAPLPRKSLLRKQSTDKQTPSTQTGRPPSSISSTSSGSSMQGQVSGIKGKMASKAKTPTSGATHRASAGSKSGGSAVVADGLVPCKMCGRRFAQDRVTLHEQICTKTTQKKRKQFDTMMYRVKGTDLEPFVKKGLCKKQPEKSKKPEPKSNWRRKHEDFINAIRSAKQVQAHLAAGGKLSDLPPPPASDTSDYIQCPHCGRKFNQSAAERHIPKCEHMLHNKPIHARAPKPKR